MKQNIIFYKYQGAGNDFLIADNRDGHIVENDGVLTVALPDGSCWSRKVADLCDRRYGVGADGLMLLEAAGDSEVDFRMTYFNSDGSGGMMCGNGGRCIVAFAADCGITHFDFLAADGFHTAQILSDAEGTKTVRLKMKDVAGFCRYDSLTGPKSPSDGYFLDTGTRHYVRFVSGLDDYDIVTEGRDIRYNASELQPIGANVNYVSPFADGIRVRTYEKGVEDETYACGTGIVASCIASYLHGIRPAEMLIDDGAVRYSVQAVKDTLAVDFVPSVPESERIDRQLVVRNVWLTGPAVYVAEVVF